MTTAMARTPSVEQSLYTAATRATLAPSIHNTQPWRFVVRSGRLDVYADPSRRVPVIDPLGRQRAISCGAAVFAARASLAHHGLDAVTRLLPDPAQEDLLATIAVVGESPGGEAIARRLDEAADTRHSNRREFTNDPLPDALIEALLNAAHVEGAWLQPVRTEADRVVVAVLSQLSDALQAANPSYRVELRAWTSDDPARPDGVPAAAVAHTPAVVHDDIPLRDFDTRSAGELPGDTHLSLHQNLFVLGTDADSRRDWLQAGQALERILLEITSAGLVASIMSQIAEEPTGRQQLRDGLRLTGHPHLLLRVGRAESTPASPRLPYADVISHDFPIPVFPVA